MSYEPKKKRRLAFMEGRYGYDTLGRFLYTLGLLFGALAVVEIRSGMEKLSDVFFVVALFFVFFQTMRMFSKSLEQRGREFEVYDRCRRTLGYPFYSLKCRIKKLPRMPLAQYRVQGSKNLRLLICPRCRQEIPVKPGQGKISVKCPQCGKLMQTKS